MTPSITAPPLSLTDKQIRFEDAVAKLKLQLRANDIDTICTRHISTLEDDLKYFLEGKSEIDPRIAPTFHMLRLAMDFAIVDKVTRGLIFARTAEYERFGEIAESFGLRWGGRWVKRDAAGNIIGGLNDIYHVEYQDLPSGV